MPTTNRAKIRWNNKLPDKEEQRSIKRQTLLNTAAKIFNEKGYNHTTLDDVADSLGVTKPTLYYYIKNKEDILFECSRTALSRMQDVVDSIEDSNRSGHEQLQELLSMYFDLMTTEFGKCLVVSNFHALSPESRNSLRQERRQIDVAVRKLVDQGIADGSLAECDPRLTTFAVFGTFNWVCHWYREDGAISAEDIKKSFMNFVMRGLLPR